MICLSDMNEAIRGAIGCRTAHVAPDALAKWLGLTPHPSSHERPGLVDKRLVYCDTAPREVQHYQIARMACAYHLTVLGLIREASPHDLAVMLCGVTSEDPSVKRAPVLYLHAARKRRTAMRC